MLFFHSDAYLSRVTKVWRKNSLNFWNYPFYFLNSLEIILRIVSFKKMDHCREVFPCVVEQVRILNWSGLLDQIRKKAIPFNFRQGIERPIGFFSQNRSTRGLSSFETF